MKRMEYFIKRRLLLLVLLSAGILTKTDRAGGTAGVVHNGNANDEESYKALKKLHAELDDDHDGTVNRLESKDYMKELEVLESQKKHKEEVMFQDDKNEKISPEELWDRWKRSQVYKWSTEEVIHWLKYTVELPEYSSVFRKHRVNGKLIPRLATPQGAYVQKELKIMNNHHRRKIYLRASDLLLFGVPDEFKPLHKDKSFMAIKAVHAHLDDDSDGKIDADESQEYMDEELGVSSSKRHLSLHNNDDQISVDELWESWQEGEVHNWSTDQVVDWLKNVVGLPQYEKVFREKQITGKYIPRIATDKSSFLQWELKIKNPKHRRKIYLKASDIILFGAPEVRRNYFNDSVVAVIIVIATVAIIYAFREKNRQRKQIEDMSKDLLSLQQAEEALKVMQETLAIAEQRQQSFDGESEREKILLEEIDAAKKEAERLHSEKDKSHEGKIKLALVEQELSEVRLALAKAELEMKSGGRIQAPKALQQWLQKTYQLESQNFQLQKNIAMSQMSDAKEACEKVSRARRSMFGTLRLAHGQTIDVVDQKIVNARGALAEVTNQLQERQHRWFEIEELCGFNVVTDGLFANFKRNASRKSSLAQALKDVAVLPLSPLKVGTIAEESSEDSANKCNVETRRLNFRNGREDSIDSSNSSKSSSSARISRNSSMVSQLSTMQPESGNYNSVLSNKIATESSEQGLNDQPDKGCTVAPHPDHSTEQPSVVHRSTSEKTFPTRPQERPLMRVHTEPLNLSQKSKEATMNGKVKSSVDLNNSSDTKSIASRNSRFIGNGSELSLDFSDPEEGSDKGNISEDSNISNISSTKKKKKKGAFRKLFHRKHKAES